MSKKYKPEDFKVGDEVWLSGAEITAAGRFRYCIKPMKTSITEVNPDNIVISTPYYPLGGNFWTESRSWAPQINKYLSKSKKESSEKFNEILLDQLDKLHNNFRNFEKKIKDTLI